MELSCCRSHWWVATCCPSLARVSHLGASLSLDFWLVFVFGVVALFVFLLLALLKGRLVPSCIDSFLHQHDLSQIDRPRLVLVRLQLKKGWMKRRNATYANSMKKGKQKLMFGVNCLNFKLYYRFVPPLGTTPQLQYTYFIYVHACDITFVFKVLRNRLLGIYFTHVQTCDITCVFKVLRNRRVRYILYIHMSRPVRENVRVQSAMQSTASVQTVCMSKPAMTFVLQSAKKLAATRCWRFLHLLHTCSLQPSKEFDRAHRESRRCCRCCCWWWWWWWWWWWGWGWWWWWWWWRWWRWWRWFSRRNCVMKTHIETDGITS